MRIIVFFLTCFLFLPLSGQKKWERLSGKFERHYTQSKFEAALDDGLKILDYSLDQFDSTDNRYVLGNYYVAMAYEALDQLEKAKLYAGKAYALLLPNMSYTETVADVFSLYGRIETGLGYHNSARFLLSRALEIRLNLNGQESKVYVQSLYDLAELEMAMALWDQMISILVEALQIHERVYPLDDSYALYANYLGLLFMNSELIQEAILYLNKSLSAYLPGRLKEDLTSANAHNNLGLVYYYQSEFENAALHFEQAASIYPKFIKDYSENYMMLLSNLASLYLSWEKPDMLESSFEALGDYLDLNAGRIDLPYIQGLENMANFYAETGEFQKSEDFYLRAIHARKSMDPPDMQGLQRTIGSLVSVCEEFNQIEKARLYLKMAEEFAE